MVNVWAQRGSLTRLGGSGADGEQEHRSRTEPTQNARIHGRHRRRLDDVRDRHRGVKAASSIVCVACAPAGPAEAHAARTAHAAAIHRNQSRGGDRPAGCGHGDSLRRGRGDSVSHSAPSRALRTRIVRLGESCVGPRQGANSCGRASGTLVDDIIIRDLATKYATQRPRPAGGVDLYNHVLLLGVLFGCPRSPLGLPRFRGQVNAFGHLMTFVSTVVGVGAVGHARSAWSKGLVGARRASTGPAASTPGAAA